MGQITLETMQKDVESLKKVVEEMKEYLEDCFLTAEEEENLEKSIEDYEQKKTKSLEEVEKNLRRNV